MSHDNGTISVIGWGMPTDPRTFSGYSRSLTLALKDRGLVRNEYSAKQVRWLDIPRGALGLRSNGKLLKLEVRRGWMWSESGSARLSERVNRMVHHAGDRGGLLQFGSVVELDPALGPSYVLTDMTIPQACRAGWFAVSRLSRKQIDVAMRVQSRVFHQASHIFTFTEWAKNSIVDEYGVAASRVTAVYTGPNLKVPPGNNGSVRKPNHVLFVGIDWERKGGPQLVEGFKLLRKRLPDAQLVIAGCSPQVRCEGVRVEGFLHPGKPDQYHRLMELYRQCSCFALMSDFEPLGIVMVEAYDAGMPVVAYDSGSRREIVSDGVTGVLCPDREPATIADALHSVLHDDTRRARMAEAARARVASDFNWNSVAGKVARAIANAAPAPVTALR